MNKRGEARYDYWERPDPLPIYRQLQPPAQASSNEKTDHRTEANVPPPQAEQPPYAQSAETHAGKARGPSKEGPEVPPPPQKPDGSYEKFEARQDHTRKAGSGPARAFRSLQERAVLLLTEPLRAQLLVARTAKHLVKTRGHFTPELLLSQALKGSTHFRVSQRAVELAASRLTSRDGLRYLQVGEQIGDQIGETVWTSRRHLRAEKRILKIAAQLSRIRAGKVKARRLKAATSRLRAYGEEFAEALKKVTDRKSRIGLLDMPFQDGRAALIQELTRVYEESGYTVRSVAPTGTAAAEFERQIRKPVRSVISLLQEASPAPLSLLIRWVLSHRSPNIGRVLKGLETVRKPQAPLTKKDVVLVYDSHLLGTRETEILLTLARKGRSKLILVGDSFRQPGVLAGGAFRYLSERPWAHRATRTEEALRPEIEAAQLLRNGSVAKAISHLASADRVHYFGPDGVSRASGFDLPVSELLDCYSTRGGFLEPRRNLVVTGTNAEAAEFNRIIQQKRIELDLLGLARVKVKSGDRVRSGDRIVFTKSNYRLGVKAGHGGTVSAVNPILMTVTVRLDRGREVKVPVLKFPHLALGYAASNPRASALSPAAIYAFVDWRGFTNQAGVAILEQATDRVDIFTPVERSELLTKVFSRDGGKTLAVSHAPEFVQNQANTLDRSHDFHHELWR